MSVKIITDSASDLSENHYTTYDIDMVSLTVQLDGRNYEDARTIFAKTVYDAMRNGKVPKTSQVSPQTFTNTFEKYAKVNQPCIYIAFSSELSGTYQSAKIAEQELKETYPNWELHILDTHCASVGQGLVALRAAELAQQGESFQTILDVATYHANHMEHIFTVDDLEYLYRGGRVSKTAAFVGSLLKIKPLLHVEEGKLVPLEKIRGSKRVLKRMVELMDERGIDLTNQTIGISHGDDIETANQLAEIVKGKYGTNRIEIEMVGSSIGAHAGPGTLALFFLNDIYK
ncbi:DegV family protein [Aquibacillus sp. 3ASR75-11]|uniref:DegV family protein n=1 Tax=Terrihalobacillus insolitus TaxID=2950438 RepID=A0A9X3WVH6_9BACI|nr:DegV family protein [Terrihalobacillus insolitus]MDC3413719.1 DegV family protein [Terrihalobacillus insolitus]MDC3425578.1 DegV family protein [Terrihalobacillus insolitus]